MSAATLSEVECRPPIKRNTEWAYRSRGTLCIQRRGSLAAQTSPTPGVKLPKTTVTEEQKKTPGSHLYEVAATNEALVTGLPAIKTQSTAKGV